MRTPSSITTIKQAGFTLIELVIVIIIIGIMAAVAVPQLTGTQDQARLAVQQATLGALKSTWTAQFATLKADPTCAQVATAMTEPTCTAAGTAITCTGVTKKDGTGSASFTCAAATLTKPGDITCDAAGC